MQKRTFTISHIVLDDLHQVSEHFHINVATIARLGILHGIEKIQNGYRPIRDHRKKIKRKFEVSLPEKTWMLFENEMQRITYEIEEHIPNGEMIELFIRIELQKFMLFYEEQDIQEERGVNYQLDDANIISVNCEIPSLLYDKIQEKKEKISIKDTQLAKYLMTCGVIQEYGLQHFDTLETDADLLKEIQVLGLDRVKAITLIRYLIANDRIVWKSRE